MNDAMKDEISDGLASLIGQTDDSCSYEYGSISGVYGGVGPYLADDSLTLDVVIPDEDDWDEDPITVCSQGVRVLVTPEELIVSREDGNLRVRGTFHVEDIS